MDYVFLFSRMNKNYAKLFIPLNNFIPFEQIILKTNDFVGNPIFKIDDFVFKIFKSFSRIIFFAPF